MQLINSSFSSTHANIVTPQIGDNLSPSHSVQTDPETSSESSSSPVSSSPAHSIPIRPDIFERLLFTSLAHPKVIKQLHAEKLKMAIYEDVVFGNLIALQLTVRNSFSDILLKNFISVLEELVRENCAKPDEAHANFATLELILMRHKQLRSANFQKKPMTELNSLRIAFYAETTLRKVQTAENQILEMKDTQLPYKIQLDFSKKVFYVISEGSDSLLHDDTTGSSKVITLALELKILEKKIMAPPKVVVCATLRKDINQELLKLAFREISFYNYFKGKRGVIQLRSTCNYLESDCTDSANQSNAIRPSLIFKKYDTDLFITLDEPNFFNLQQQITISEDLIHGLANIHGQGIIHGDLKLENALYRTDSSGKVVSVIIDFGFAFDLLKNEPANFIYQTGYYGSLLNTAPELFGRTNFSGSYIKTDVWALGMLLYEIRFGKAAPWAEVIRNMYMTNCKFGKHQDLELLAQTQTFVLDQIQKEVLPKLAQYQRADLSKEERFEKLIYRMLHPEPTQRITLQDAKDEIALCL